MSCLTPDNFMQLSYMQTEDPLSLAYLGKNPNQKAQLPVHFTSQSPLRRNNNSPAAYPPSPVAPYHPASMASSASSDESDDSWRTAKSKLSGSSPQKELSLPTPSLSPLRITITAPSPSSPLSPPPNSPPPSPEMAQTSTCRVNDLGNGIFDLVVWRNPDTIGDENWVDVWVAELGLDPAMHIPCIPQEYEGQRRDDRAVFLFGVPNSVAQGDLQAVVEMFGKVERMPLIIDLLSQETFRFAIMASTEAAHLVIKSFKKVFPSSLIPEGHHGSITAVTPLAPGRSRIRYRPSTSLPTGSFQSTDQLKAAIDSAPSLFYSQQTQDLLARSLFTTPFNHQPVQTPLSAQQAQQTTLSDTPGDCPIDTPTRLPARRSKPIFPDISTSESKGKAKENVDPKGDGIGKGGHMMSTAVYTTENRVQQPPRIRLPVDPASEVIRNDPPGMWQNGIWVAYTGPIAQTYTMNPNANPFYGNPQAVAQTEGNNPCPLYQSYAKTQIENPPPSLIIDPLIDLLRQSAYTVPAEAPAEFAQPPGPIGSSQPAPIVPIVPIGPPARKPSNPLVAVPDIAALNERARARSLSVSSKGGSASKTKPASTTKAVKKPLATVAESSKAPKEETIPQPAEAPEPAAAPKPVSSWAAVAGTLPSGSTTIDVSNKTSARLRGLTHLPVSGPNPSKTEPLVDQMRIVFLLDVPTTLTLEDVSDALSLCGPIRSIHFGKDEDKHTRYCAVIFLHATDASKFTNALQKERADNHPVRFKFIVEVVRSEEPTPLDDTLRSMLPPINATRRLTLVKKAFFTAYSKRDLTQRIERIAGDSCIQKIFFYNSGNATIFFSDVGSATLCKAEFERLATTNETWRDLGVSYSKDPCTVDASQLRLISVNPSWNR